jgi:hypothetical protein
MTFEMEGKIGRHAMDEGALAGHVPLQLVGQLDNYFANDRERAAVEQQIRTNKVLTCLANARNDGGRILRLSEVIGGPDEEIVMVHKPVAKLTLDTFIANHHSRYVCHPVIFSG